MNTGFSYLASADLTDVGRRRKNNEDSILSLPAQGVFCVADGMGGVQGGEVASKATVDALKEAFTASPDAPYALTAAASARLVARALNRASQWIKARSEERGLAGSGSTAVVLAFDRATPSKAVILHAGDSRAYRLRGDTLVQLSADHSVAAAAGLADDKDLPAMFRGVITRAVGLEDTVRLEETPADVAPGDLFLLCSDGLTKMVGDKHIHKLLHRHLNDGPQAVAQVLVDEALKAGGEDNVSVVVVRVGPELPAAPTLDVPPETLALEVPDAPPEPPAPPPEPYPEEAPTRETDQTVDTADGNAAPAQADKPAREPETPVTPPSGEGVTPVTPVTAPRPHSRHLTIITLLVLLVIVLGLAVTYLRQRPSQAQPGAAGPAATPPVEALNLDPPTR